ncbi:MAG: tRNA pseudouridine(13) synthase TruD [Candidatus Nanoarchaeia archaeon]|jgi:tRNA(Glu) U13 pseudouridine synthase TruD
MNIPRPEGFVVNEIPGDYKQGDCTHFTLWKKGWNTLDAIRIIAKQLRVGVERFGYAGLKDRDAITTQRVSAWRVPIIRLKQLSINNLQLSDFIEQKERIKIGSHKGNKFEIILEGISKLRKPVNVPNLFGPQRFGGNELLGKLLLEGKWEEITKQADERVINDYLRQKPGDYLGAVRAIDKRIRFLWVNAWQAYQWNNELDITIDKQELKDYSMIKEMPELGTFKGGLRITKLTPSDYKAVKIKDGFKVSFGLPKGSYATTIISYITTVEQ